MLFRMKDEKAHQLEAELDKLQADGPAAWAKLPEEELFTPAGFSEERAEATSYSNYSYWGSTFRAFFKNRVAVLLLVALIAVVAFAFLQPYLPGQVDPNLCAVDPVTGIQYRNIALRHIFRNAMVPLVQYIPSAFLNTVVGSIYIESLYSIPGMGGLLVTCVQRHDNTMVQGIVLLYACVGIIGLILGDLLMVLIDPRINFGKKEGGR